MTAEQHETKIRAQIYDIYGIRNPKQEFIEQFSKNYSKVSHITEAVKGVKMDRDFLGREK